MKSTLKYTLSKHRQKQVTHVANILGILKEHAASLLRHFRWNKERLIERYMDDLQDVLRKAGVILRILGRRGSAECLDLCLAVIVTRLIVSPEIHERYRILSNRTYEGILVADHQGSVLRDSFGQGVDDYLFKRTWQMEWYHTARTTAPKKSTVGHIFGSDGLC
ncbi:4872_t:CDS:2 [Paraglomus brasilianum]|uniref:4872_t:CDS:1 n=1 Tax=Paraglomus brasilianum TaxID=144538 RepID=A0A9N8W0G6_9GLOM|nr:4872_t:CDS:2 [Paraglomus brasilianum]